MLCLFYSELAWHLTKKYQLLLNCFESISFVNKEKYCLWQNGLAVVNAIMYGIVVEHYLGVWFKKEKKTVCVSVGETNAYLFVPYV